MRIQTAFLETPMLSLTLPEAQRWFGVDEVTCAGVLDALVEARVLTRRDGGYRRYFHSSRRWPPEGSVARRRQNPEVCGGRRL